MQSKTRRLSFGKEYFKDSLVQTRQNAKFIRFIFQTLKEFDFVPKVIMEAGIGDHLFAKKLSRIFLPSKFYLLDMNPVFVESISKEVVNPVPIVKNFIELNESLFEEKPDLIVSTNALHWLPSNRKCDENDFWYRSVKNFYSVLKEGGFFFIHQGLKWTYFPYYDLACDLFESKYRKRPDLKEVLYYPVFSEFRARLRHAGFKIVDEKEFYELELFDNAPYTREELTKSFAVAGLNAVLAFIEDEKEKENFRTEFKSLCAIMEPPVFSHRGFIALRKPVSSVVFRVISPGSANEKDRRILEDLLREVSNDFYPPLDVRGPDDTHFTTLKGRDYYLNELLCNYHLIFAFYENEVSGFFAFREKESFCFPGKRAIYISTFAVRRKYRRCGIGKQLFDHFFEILPDFTAGRKILLVETRTWSMNEKSSSLLLKSGFELAKRIENHRGEGIHTDYYVKFLI